jgi:hypothetical protein
MLRPRACITCLFICLLCAAPSAEGQSPQPKPETVDFGEIRIADEWEHTFRFENSGSEVLEIKNVQLTPPLVVTSMSVRVQPGDSGSVTVRLDKPREMGKFRGSVVVNFRNQGSEPVLFDVLVKLVPPVDFEPFPIFFVSTQRGQPKTDSIEIIGHEPEPFEILGVKHSSSRFTTKVEALQPGRRYRLSLTMKGDGPAGPMSDTITLATSSREHPLLEIRANTNLNERVHAFPDAIDLGTMSTEYLKTSREKIGPLTTRLMVYQEGGKNFQISAESDVPFLKVSTLQAQLKDRYEVRLAVVPDKLKPGEVNGTVVIVTNDPEFPRLTIPVRVVVDGSR